MNDITTPRGSIDSPQDRLLDQAIRSALMNTIIYGKVRFDNAKDTQELIAAANENGELLLESVKSKLSERVEQMLVERLERDLAKGDVFVRIGSKTYEVQEA